MKIAIDARFYGEAGPGRYVAQLISNLEEIDNDNDYTIFLKVSNFGLYKPSNSKFSKALADFHWYSFSEQFLFPIILYRGNFDLVHFAQINAPLLYFRPFLVTIHDVILHEFSTMRGKLADRLLYRLKKMAYLVVFWKDVFLSKAILVPSNSTKTDLLKYYRVNPDKVLVTYESVDHYPSGRFSGALEVLNKYGIRKPYIISIGSFYPHKNLNRLVEAFKSVRQRQPLKIQLVFVGKESPFSRILRESVESDGVGDVIFPGFLHPQGYLPDDEVEALISKASAYVQTALKEGFGIPPVEAMVFGVPAAVSKIPCFEEMCGDGALYFDPLDVNDIADKLIQILSQPSLRDDLIQKGYRNVKRFSWRKMAEETLKAYRRVVEDG